MATRRRTLAEAATAMKQRIEVNDEGCWVWTGCLTTHGYASVGFDAKSVLGHRLMYLAEVGPIPDDLPLDHVCHNESGCLGGRCQHRACVNPAHLEPVTYQENVRRSPRARKTHCPAGHAYDEANTRYSSEGHRFCRACNREASAQSKIRRAMRAANVRLDGAA